MVIVVIWISLLVYRYITQSTLFLCTKDKLPPFHLSSLMMEVHFQLSQQGVVIRMLLIIFCSVCRYRMEMFAKSFGTRTISSHWGTGCANECRARLKEMKWSVRSYGINITVQCRYNAVYYLKIPHNRHPIARPWGRDMECLLCVPALINVLPLSLKCCILHRVMLDRAVMTHLCNFAIFVLVSVVYITDNSGDDL